MRVFVIAGLLILTAAVSRNTHAQKSRDTTSLSRDSLISQVVRVKDSLDRKKNPIRFGLTIGPRFITDLAETRLNRRAHIDPVTRNVAIDEFPATDMILSGAVAVFPFDDTGRAIGKLFGNWLGFLLNISIASINSQSIASFNRSIEGGVGLVGNISDHVALGVTYERVSSRRLRYSVPVGQPLVVGADTLTAITEDDDRFFVDDGFSAIAVKLALFF